MDDLAARATEHLRRIFHSAVAAVSPDALVHRHLQRDGRWAVVVDGGSEISRWEGTTLIVGAGKAVGRMAAACEQLLGASTVSGLVIVPDGCDTRLSSIGVAAAGHPIPDWRGVAATALIGEQLANARRGGALALISGGASSLLVRPRPPITLEQKQRVTELLLSSGASIQELNAVRKHLSLVKGGGLLRMTAHRPLTSLALSDVVGDDPSVIGSGPTAADPSRFEDAWAVLAETRLAETLPLEVAELLRAGLRGEIEETVKSDDHVLDGSHWVLIGSNRIALDHAAAAASDLGYETMVTSEPLIGDTTVSARRWIVELGARARRLTRPLCLIAGGETTVTVRGTGQGGRNQEFALALAEPLAGVPIHVLSAGTDGVDGPTPAAGAFVDGSTLARARDLGLDPAAFLARNDSYNFFSALGDLFVCGPTQTNVMDIKVALAFPGRSDLLGPQGVC
jgi:hydroxypyruvate reductase